ncbi:MAG TPA: HAD-IA family hydrolase [Candidatus Dormibacteraeota bacterium]
MGRRRRRHSPGPSRGRGRRNGDPALLSPRLQAVVFDFDGLIVDTETPLFTTWAEFFREHGHELELERFTDVIGSADHFDPVLHLEGLVGAFDDREAVRERIRERYYEKVWLQDPLPGVVEAVSQAQALALGLGVASSSRRPWIEQHLERLGLRSAFACLACREDPPGLRGKPHPDVYEAVLLCLGVEPAAALAIEDSPNGIRAAKTAGLRCLAVPNGLTAHLDLSEADALAASLTEVSLDAFL